MNRIFWSFFIATTILSCTILSPGPILADGFSLFGVTMGMTRADLETHWQKGGGDQYTIEGSTLVKILPEFDHLERLYKLSFSLPIPLLDQHPVPYVTTSIQDLLQERWESDDMIVNIRTGRGVADVVLTQRQLQEEYIQHIRSQMLMQLGVLLKP